MIAVEHLSKTFWIHRKEAGLLASIRSLVVRPKVAKEAVRDVSFQVAEGEVVGLIGANGAGKTTLVKMLAGIVHPTSGDARVLGHRPWLRDDALRRRMALIMGQKAQLWWDLPAADGFLLLKEIYGLDDRTFREQRDRLVELLEVGAEMDVQIRRLSLGERMKMELIAALLHSPRVVYLDEPTIGLDLSAQRAIREFILAYRAEHQPAMLVTSHYMEDIERLCERILILRRGRLVYDGSRREVVERFATSKVVTAHLRRAPSTIATERLAELGQVTASTDAMVRLDVPRDRVAPTTSALMELLDIVDLSIEEEPLGHVVERLQRARGEEADGVESIDHAEDALPPPAG
ncbi:MAG: ATP-binding cassette domain-containing protein [Acidobacteriota bacterium]